MKVFPRMEDAVMECQVTTRDVGAQVTVAIVRTGVANIASVAACFQRLGTDPTLIDDPRKVEAAPLLVLPGVGTLGAAMAELRSRDLVAPLRARLVAGRPTLAICLGLQLLARSSEESPGAEGLGIIDGVVRRLGGGDARVRVPQLGWNAIEPGGQRATRLLTRGVAYFANSYALTDIPAGFAGAIATHGTRFVAAIEREGLLACQFHPELSGTFGHRLVRAWIALALERSAC